MSDLISRTAKLVPYARRPKNSASFVTAFVYEPSADEIGAKLGNLYIVVEVLTSGRASEEVVDLVIQAAGDKYYNEPNGELDPLARFEAAVKQTNHELSEYVGRGNASWIGKLSAIIAVQSGKELHLTQTGSAEAFLYRGKAVSRITVSESARPATPLKTFGSIATGELEEGDKFLIATPALVHQVPLAKLQTVITTTSPNTAISELSQLLAGADTNRIAAIVVDITTPELAALKVRSDEPDEIELHSPENFAEAAISAATPLAQTTADNSRKAARAAVSVWQSYKPRVRTAIFTGLEKIRGGLSTKRGRRSGAAIAIGLAVLLILSIWLSHNQTASAKDFSNYQELFRQYNAAQAAAAAGDKADAHSALISLQSKISKLGGTERSINSQLKNNALLQGEPTSVSEFRTLLSDQLDQLDGLVKATPMTVTEIGGKSGRPTHFESDGVRAYVIDAANHNAISIVNLQTGVQKDSGADTSKLGVVNATTLSSANDGMFILTNKPSVWFYRFSNDTLAEQTIAYGSWPKSSAIASYASNLYLLGTGAVYKLTSNASGYSPPTNYISTTPAATNPTGLAVDGWVYLSAPSGLHRFLGSVLKLSTINPPALTNVINLRSEGAGTVIIGTSPANDRIALWTATDTQLTFDKQISVQSGKTLYDAIYDQKLGLVFATIDNRLVSFPIKP